MKKIFNLILAALVIIGAAACTKNEEVAYQGGEGLSFYAEIVNGNTRAYIDDSNNDKTWNTIWEEGDNVYVGADNADPYIFTYANGKFTCTDDGVTSLIGETVTVGPCNVNEDSTAGKKAWSFTGTKVEKFDNNATVNLTADTSFFRYTYNGTGDVTITVTPKEGDTKVFSYCVKEDVFDYYSSITFKGAAEDKFVGFWPQTLSGLEATLSYSIDGKTCKEKDIELYPGKVYNLGTLTDPVESKVWGTAGEHNNWAAGNPAPMYEMGDYVVAYNLAGDKKLKFVKIGAGNSGWDGAVGGAATTATQANVWTDTGGNDIILPSGGPYDVYLLPSFKYCVVEAGKTPEKFDAETYDLYLKPNSNWMQANARFAAYFFKNDNSGKVWANMTTVADGIYGVKIPDGYTSSNCKVIFCRMNPSATANDWSNKWNQTGDLKIPTDGKNLYTINNGSWDAGTWSVKQ